MSERDVAVLAQELHTFHMAHAAMMTLMQHPSTGVAISAIERENQGPAVVPIEAIERKDGSQSFFDLSHALRTLATDPTFREVYSRIWFTSALIVLGDALSDHGYFDKDPALEFVRHLRNGVGHGNKFNLIHGEPSRPARFSGPDQRFLGDRVTPPGSQLTFEIAPALHGQTVLFDFIGPGDLIDLFMFVSWKLMRMANGDPPMPLFPQLP